MFAEQVSVLGFAWLPIQNEHVLQIATLPFLSAILWAVILSFPTWDCAFDLFIRLLMPQRFNRVHLCGAAGRKVAENHSDPG